MNLRRNYCDLEVQISIKNFLNLRFTATLVNDTIKDMTVPSVNVQHNNDLCTMPLLS